MILRKRGVVALLGMALLGIWGGERLLRRDTPHPIKSQATLFRESGDNHLKVGRVTAAVIDYNRAVAEAPQDEQGYIGLALLYESQGRADLALEALEQLRVSSPKAPHLCSRLAEAYLGVEDFGEARRVAQEATLCEPSNPLAFLTCGVALAEEGAWDKAIEALRKAHFLAPKDTDIGMTLMEVYLQKGDLAHGIQLGKEMLHNLPGSARLHYKLGWAYSRQKQMDLALEHLKAAVERAPDWFAPHAERGRIYRSLNRVKEARRAFEMAAHRNANVLGVLLHLHALQKAAGDPQHHKTAQRLARLQQGVNAWQNLHNMAKRQPMGAKRVLEMAKADALAGHYAPALYRLKQLLRKEPTQLEALRLYRALDEQARAQSPNYLHPGPNMVFPFDS